MKACDTCFYKSLESTKEPCRECCESGCFRYWVAADVFKNIDNHGEAMAQRVIPPPQYDPENVAFNRAIPGAVGVKYDNDKPQWSLLPFKALKEVVDVLTYGAKKYAPDNWKKVPDARQRYIDAGFRHFTAYASGEKNDSETGMSHLAHATCCMLFLMSFDKDDSLKDRDE